MAFPQTVFRRWWLIFLLVASLLVASTKPGFAQVKASIPTTAQQKDKSKVLEEIYKLSRLETAAKKQEVVKELVKHSRDQNLPPDERWAVLTTLISLTKETGDFANWLDAVNRLIGAFDVDARKEKQRLLVDFLESSKSGTTLKPVAVEDALAMVRLAAQENRYADAKPLLIAVEAAVRRPPSANALLKAVAETRDTIATREKDWNALQAASVKLADNASDPSANFTVGHWHLLHQSDWKTALPFLAKASDANWKAAAERELTVPLDATAQVAVGDAWWDIGQTEAGATRTALLLHARDWYARAQPNLPTSLKKQAVIRRLDELAELKATALRRDADVSKPSGAKSVEFGKPKFMTSIPGPTAKAIGIIGGSTGHGAAAIQWDLVKTAANQQWELVPTENEWFQIKNRGSGLVLCVAGASNADGAKIIQWPDNKGHHQQWKAVPVVHRNVQLIRLVNRQSGKALSLEKDSRDNFVPLVQLAPTKSASQQFWNLIDVD